MWRQHHFPNQGPHQLSAYTYVVSDLTVDRCGEVLALLIMDLTSGHETCGLINCGQNCYLLLAILNP